MTTTNHLGITLVEQSQAQKEITVNQALTRLDAVLNSGAKSQSVTTPPGSPASGDLYIVAASAIGAWSGHDGQLVYFDQIWKFITPNEGMTLWVNDEDKTYIYNGSSWVLSSSSGSGTVTSVSVTTANGVSGSVANATTTPAISLTLGAITPSSVAATGTVIGSNLSGTNTGDQTSVSGNAGSATVTAITDDTMTNATMYPTWVTTTTGNLPQKISSSKLTFNPSTGALTATGFVGALTGNASGSSGSCTGNAATATALQTGRTINGTTFDGTGNITVTAAAGTLTGTTLNSSVVTSSLTSVGTIGTGVWQGTKVGLAYGGTNADLSATGGSGQYLKQNSSGATVTVSAVAESELTFTDITTNNVSTSKHGFAPKLPNDATKYLDGTGAYSVPSGGGGGGSPGGSSGQIQYNSSGSFGGAAGFIYQSGSSPNLTMQAQNAAHVPFVAKGAASQTADLFEAQNSSGTVLFSLDNHGRPIALADGTTTIAAGAGAGTSPTISITGNDVCGIINLTTGSSPAAGVSTIATITFANAYGTAPKTVLISSSGANQSTRQQYVSSISTTGWVFSAPNNLTLAAATTYAWYYLVIG